jgi:hypothetical protein
MAALLDAGFEPAFWRVCGQYSLILRVVASLLD